MIKRKILIFRMMSGFFTGVLAFIVYSKYISVLDKEQIFGLGTPQRWQILNIIFFLIVIVYDISKKNYIKDKIYYRTISSFIGQSMFFLLIVIAAMRIAASM